MTAKTEAPRNDVAPRDSSHRWGTTTNTGVVPPTAYPVLDDGDSADPEPTEATRRLLRLMRTGAIDETIARELGVSLRTVHRRITRLQNLLGARSRFELGVITSERGWL